MLDNDFKVVLGASLPLPGKIQTVPRAELYAMYTVVRNVSGGAVRIVSDSEINVNMYYNNRDYAYQSANGVLLTTSDKGHFGELFFCKLFFVCKVGAAGAAAADELLLLLLLLLLSVAWTNPPASFNDIAIVSSNSCCSCHELNLMS